MNPAANIFAGCKPMNANIAARLAANVPRGWYVNLGIGAPLQVADYVPGPARSLVPVRDGILGMGPAPDRTRSMSWLMIGRGAIHHTAHSSSLYAPHQRLGLIRSSQILDLLCWARDRSPRMATSPTGQHRTTPRDGFSSAIDLAADPAAVGADRAHDQDRRKQLGRPLRLSG